MIGIPRTIHLTQGAAEGTTPLNAFDNALAQAGVHNLNLVRVSSIVPKGCEFGPNRDWEVGTLMPAVYSFVTSSVRGETISACIGAGIGELGGVLMEYHHLGRGDDAEIVVAGMIEEAFSRRCWELQSTRYVTASHQVDRVGGAVAVALLFDLEVGNSPSATR